ncbi:MAG: hypothetical protein HYV15_05305 [Elusimicrobia bacterium]|nr:hypothetical protein [Elusimicrobiota bacterium]
MGERGVLVGKGSFRVDREAALKKLAAFQLADAELLVPWVRLAVCRGAKRLSVGFSGGRVAVSFDGPPLPAAVVKDPLSALLAAEARRPELLYLAAGMLGLERAAEKPSLSSGADGTVVSAVIVRDEPLLRARRALPEALAFCPLEVLLDGVRVIQPSLDGLEWAQGAVRFAAAPSADPWQKESRVRLCVHGAAAQAVARDTPRGRGARRLPRPRRWAREGRRGARRRRPGRSAGGRPARAGTPGGPGPAQGGAAPRRPARRQGFPARLGG